MEAVGNAPQPEPWNKGKIVGQKAPFKPKDIWALRVRLQMEGRTRELALLNLGVDSKLRGCDLVALKVRDVGPFVAGDTVKIEIERVGSMTLPVGECEVRAPRPY